MKRRATKDWLPSWFLPYPSQLNHSLYHHYHSHFNHSSNPWHPPSPVSCNPLATVPPPLNPSTSRNSELLPNYPLPIPNPIQTSSTRSAALTFSSLPIYFNASYSFLLPSDERYRGICGFPTIGFLLNPVNSTGKVCTRGRRTSSVSPSYYIPSPLSKSSTRSTTHQRLLPQTLLIILLCLSFSSPFLLLKKNISCFLTPRILSHPPPSTFVCLALQVCVSFLPLISLYTLACWC